MDKRGYGVAELKDILKSSGNEKALECLLAGLDGDDSLMHEDTTTHRARKRKGRVRSSSSLEESSDLHTKKRHKRYRQEAKYSQRQISGTRETLIRDARDQYNAYPGPIETLEMDSVINQRTEDSALYDSDSRTSETLTNSCIKQTTVRIGLRNRDPGTKGMARMDHPTAQPKDSLGLQRPAPGTRETLLRASPNHPEPPTRLRATQNIDHPIHLPYPVQERNDFNQGIHNNCHFETLPPENDKTQNQDVDYEATTAPINNLITRGQKVPIEHEENQQESVTRGIRPTLSSLFKWVISCGSQGDAM